MTKKTKKEPAKAKPKVKKTKVKKAVAVPMSSPKILVFDIETAPILAHVWGLWENNVGLNQIQSDWHILSWSAKWLSDSADKVMYQDQRGMKNIADDSKILKGIWNLLDEADIVITQNGKRFDQKKLNARFILSGFPPPSSYRHIDTQEIAKRHFAFTSNKLAYMTDKLCVTYKKLTNHGKFPGHELWNACLRDDIEAWEEMELYNKYDVLSLEELYHKLIVWDNRINFNVYTDSLDVVCKCGSKDFIKNGFSYTNTSKFQKYRCKSCGSECRDKKNLLSSEKKESLKRHAHPSKSE
ncbi:Ribonuclease H-like domain containing protein [uncultured Caudovirales phage]|uniref:Ribonuclease H-like domain containing protein n=1 Tax=uncultured Caudovirales phage TaxID=2100421 RepID=A0A6J5KRK5_9CAUD|nr:Ribonuclease H-like domain containing protein [uncultured Caudovirales phage]